MTSPDTQKLEQDPVDPNIGLVSNQNDTDLDSGRHWEGTQSDLLNVARGFCMGAADTVPGVSGGTVALILGHYQRLVSAISRVDRHFVSLVLGRRWAEAIQYVDGRFLIAIAVGIVAGIAMLAGLMHWLLDTHMPETFAVFFGLIFGSVLVVRRLINRWTPTCYMGCVAGITVAIAIGRLSPSGGLDSLFYLFLSASIAICAMILPGISGAFVLLLLGVYHPIIGLIKNLVKGNFDVSSLLQLSVFAVGCLFGLLAFSRLLRWLLEHRHDVTMATLVGLMLGSAEKLWPLQLPTPETATLEMKERVMRYVTPAEWNGGVALLVLLAVGAAALVLVLERVGKLGSVTDRETVD